MIKFILWALIVPPQFSGHSPGFDLRVEIQFNSTSTSNPHAGLVLINLLNVNRFMEFDAVSVRFDPTLSTQCSKQIQILPPIHSEQLVCSVQDIQPGERIYVKYSYRGSEGSLAYFVPVQSAEGSNTPLGIFGTGLFALLGVILGGILTHLLTQAREREKSRIDYLRAQFERYEKPFIAFLSCWNESTSLDVLRNCYQKLQADCLVPSDITRAYLKTVKLLSEKCETPEAKIDACVALRGSFESFLAKYRI